MMEGEHYLRILYSIQNDDEDDIDDDDDDDNDDDNDDVQDSDYDKGVTCCRAQCPEAICGWKEHAKCQHLMMMTMTMLMTTMMKICFYNLHFIVFILLVNTDEKCLLF